MLIGLKKDAILSVVPFAGLVYKPPGKTAFQATADNFAECGQKVHKDLTNNRAVQPLHYIMNNIADVFKIVVKGFIKEVHFIIFVQDLQKLFGDIFNRISAVMVPLQHMIIGIKTAVEKSNGIGATVV